VTVDIRLATTAEDVAEVRQLFLEYAQSLGFSLCFQGFDEEMATFPAKYVGRGGFLLLGAVDGKPAGAVGLWSLGDGACEMKRLFVRPEARGHGLGRRLALALMQGARERGYALMRLDTLTTMTEAIALYRSLGFEDAPPYTENPLAEALFMQLRLSGREGARVG
jgi:ribosomal protein S18 acetylase RimI-like enzyme